LKTTVQKPWKREDSQTPTTLPTRPPPPHFATYNLTLPPNMASPTIAILSTGEMGLGIASLLVAHSFPVITERSPASAENALMEFPRPPEDVDLVQRADYILSLVPPSQAPATARRIQEALWEWGREGMKKELWYIDLNAVLPATARKMTEEFKETVPCVRFVAGGIVGAPPAQTQEGVWTKPVIRHSGAWVLHDAPLDGARLAQVLNTRYLGKDVGKAGIPEYTRQAVWDAKVAESGHYDKIAVQNLEVSVNSGTDVWGRKKPQRAYISVTVTLGQQFASASSTDTVDESTIHYGILSKAVQARLQSASSDWVSTPDLSSSVRDSVKKVSASTPIYAIETSVSYLKGSMFGDAVTHTTSCIETTGERTSTLHLRNVLIPCLIGVNANERLKKQPVVLNLWVSCIPDSRVDDYAELETLVFNIIAETSYQTIESLLEFVVEELRQKFFTQEDDQNVWIRIRVAKPLAVPAADAPAVEISRPIKTS
jgi:FolB domain-containing protein